MIYWNGSRNPRLCESLPPHTHTPPCSKSYVSANSIPIPAATISPSPPPFNPPGRCPRSQWPSAAP